MTDHIHEECGVFGIFSAQTQDVAATAYYALFALQHRGQESCGIVVNRDGVFSSYKDVGLVNDVFTADILKQLGEGEAAIGHVRYSTTGGGGRENAQPVVVNHLKGNMALAHNGNLVNSYELRSELENEGSIFHTTSDTEVIAYTVTKERVRQDKGCVFPRRHVAGKTDRSPRSARIPPAVSGATVRRCVRRRIRKLCAQRGGSAFRA